MTAAAARRTDSTLVAGHRALTLSPVWKPHSIGAS